MVREQYNKHNITNKRDNTTRKSIIICISRCMAVKSGTLPCTHQPFYRKHWMELRSKHHMPSGQKQKQNKKEAVVGVGGGGGNPYMPTCIALSAH